MGRERVAGGERKGKEREGKDGGRALPPTVSSNNAYGYMGYADIRWGSAG